MEVRGNPGRRPADASKAPTGSDLPSHDQREHLPSLYLLLLFLVLAACIVATGYFFYSHFEQNFRAAVEIQLSSVSELKVGQLVQWRKERMADASAFYRNRAFSGLVERLLKTPADTDVRDRILSWLDRVQDASQYDRVFILDAQGIERLAVPGTPEPVASHMLQQIPEILRSNKIAFLDFHRDTPDHPIHLGLVVPVREEPDGGRPLGVLALRIDPATYLYPFIQQWPAPSRTAQTLLIRRERDEALFLNELRFRKNSALSLRIPLDKGGMPAVKAALGQEGIVEGDDYRGVPVLADMRRVPGSPWFLVTCMDATEVNAPLQERLWMIIGLVAALLFGAGAGVGLIWRQQRLRFFLERLAAAEALRKSHERFLLANRATYNAIWDWDLRTNALDWNENFQTLFGYGAEEIEPSIESWTNRIHPEDLERVRTGIHEAIDSGRHSWADQYRFRFKDGRYAVIDDRGYIARQADGSPVRMIGAMQDITERKRNEETIKRQLDEITSYYDNAPIGLAVLDTDLRFLRINNMLAEINGIPAVEHIGKTVKEIVPALEEQARKVTSEIIRTGKPIKDLEFSGETAAEPGVKRFFLESWHPIKRDSEKIAGFTVIVRDVTERKRAEEALQASLREKEVLLREVHHRVKNNMQVISSLFNLQAGHTTNEECRAILKEGQTRIRSMSLVHEKLYQSRDLSKIDLAGYIQSLTAHLFHVYLVKPAQVRMETDFEDVSMDINSAVPCGLILNELVSNALKHAFPEGRTGVIKIGLRHGPGGAVELRVADNGVGFPEGLDFRKAESFGLQIVNMLVDQLEAAIDLDRTKGAAFTMTFRELKYAPRA